MSEVRAVEYSQIVQAIQNLPEAEQPELFEKLSKLTVVYESI